MTILIRSAGESIQQQRFKSQVLALLDEIRRSLVGQAVLSRLEFATQRITIRPFTPVMHARRGRANASTLPGDFRAAGNFGSGAPSSGSGSGIYFTPGLVPRSNPQVLDSSVLVHEMAHSLRAATGTARFERRPFNQIASPRVPTYGNTEEFFACMVESVHQSELGARVRGDSWRLGRQTPAFLSQRPYSTRLRDFARRLPAFVDEMSAIDAGVAPFNPSRDVAVQP